MGRIEEISARCMAATPAMLANTKVTVVRVDGTILAHVITGGPDGRWQAERDAAFFAAAYDDVEFLLAERAALLAALTALRNAVSNAVARICLECGDGHDEFWTIAESLEPAIMAADAVTIKHQGAT